MVDTDETKTLYLVDDSNKRAWIVAPNQAWLKKQRALRTRNNNEGKRFLLGIDISQDQLDLSLKAGMAIPVDHMLAEREGFVPGPEAPEIQPPKEVAPGQRSPTTMSKKGLWWVFGSAFGGLVLMTRVKTIFGTRIFITSGNNLFDARGFQLSEGAYSLLWAVVLGGICYGVWLILQDRDRVTGSGER